jgi:RNA polymerase sigma-70 factor (ECF subfamily)
MLRPRPSPRDADEFATVLAAAQAGDAPSIASLYRRFNPALVRFLEGRAPGSGPDLAQDTWIGACTNLAGFDGDDHEFRAWLFTIARRRLIDHWRRVARQPATPTDPEMFTHREVPDTASDGLDAQEAVARIVRHLSAEQADVVLLRVVAGLSVDQVAAIVGKSPGAVRVIQHRALRRLAAALASEAVTPRPSAAIAVTR